MRSCARPTRVRTDQRFTTSNAPGEKSGIPGGIERPNSDQIAAFFDLLTSCGFTEAQLMLINDTLREAGLQISDMDEVSGRPRNRT
ncbi:MAG TPA: hypothetical protein EYG03_24645 [Planctomycetes bacterium]|nr:hypothetical protein [Fuerstiella sp.]HIK95144.1 hypothetical protein [Planctomycetota bacterium]